MPTKTNGQFLSTQELAEIFQVKPQSIRHAYCVDGHYLGMTPLKLPNRLLAWPSSLIPEIIQQYNSGQEIGISFAECFSHGNTRQRNAAEENPKANGNIKGENQPI